MGESSLLSPLGESQTCLLTPSNQIFTLKKSLKNFKSAPKTFTIIFSAFIIAAFAVFVITNHSAAQLEESKLHLPIIRFDHTLPLGISHQLPSRSNGCNNSVYPKIPNSSCGPVFGCAASELMAEMKVKRVSFSLENEYRDLLQVIADLGRRSMTDESRMMIDRRAVELGLKPIAHFDPKVSASVLEMSLA